MFPATGVQAILLMVVVLRILPDGPESAPWLSPEQRTCLVRTIEEERGGGHTDHGNPFAALLNRRVLMLAGIHVAFPLSADGLSDWLPTVVKSFGVSNLMNGFINIIPWIVSAAALWWVPRHAACTQATGNALTWHVARPSLIAAVALALIVVLAGAAS